MKNFIPVLKKCPLFLGIAEDELVRMLTCLGARVHTYDKNSPVFEEGSSPKSIGVILSGAVQTQSIDYYGNKNIISEEHTSDSFCESFACAEIDYVPVSIVSSEPSEIMLIDCSHILHTCEKGCGFHQQLIYNLMKSLAIKNVFFHKRMEITSKRTTRDKLIAYLDLCSRECDSRSFDIPFDRQELADYLEVDRSGLSTEIGKLCREGIIKNQKNHFELL